MATTAQIARLLGITRQGLTQAMARDADAPRHVILLGESRGYDVDEVKAWWTARLEGRTREWTERRRYVASEPSAQMNIRITARDTRALEALRIEGESLNSAARRLLRQAIGTLDPDVSAGQGVSEIV